MKSICFFNHHHGDLINTKSFIKEIVSNADIIHENGVYIGNSQFVTEKQLNKIDDILKLI